jgi:hypothetical protein
MKNLQKINQLIIGYASTCLDMSQIEAEQMVLAHRPIIHELTKAFNENKLTDPEKYELIDTIIIQVTRSTLRFQASAIANWNSSKELFSNEIYALINDLPTLSDLVDLFHESVLDFITFHRSQHTPEQFLKDQNNPNHKLARLLNGAKTLDQEIEAFTKIEEVLKS